MPATHLLRNMHYVTHLLLFCELEKLTYLHTRKIDLSFDLLGHILRRAKHHQSQTTICIPFLQLELSYATKGKKLRNSDLEHQLMITLGMSVNFEQELEITSKRLTSKFF